MRISYWKRLAAKVSFKNTRQNKNTQILIKIFGKDIQTKSAHLIFYMIIIRYRFYKKMCLTFLNKKMK
jgi:hypothetical protein